MSSESKLVPTSSSTRLLPDLPKLVGSSGSRGVRKVTASESSRVTVRPTGSIRLLHGVVVVECVPRWNGARRLTFGSSVP